MPLTAAARTRNARRAALQRSATEDTTAMTASAREAFTDSFLPGGSRGGPDIPGLPESERQRRAKAARSLYFSRLRERQLAARRGL
jgi:hypothetical protein